MLAVPRQVGLVLTGHCFPFIIAHDGNGDIEAVERGFEGNTFDDIEVTAHAVNKNSEEPLLNIFAGECPQAHEAQRIGEAVKHWHRTVGVVGEDIPGSQPCHEEKQNGGGIKACGHMGDGHFLPLLLQVLAAELPYEPSVNGGEGVIDRHGCVAVETVAVIETNVESRHNDAHEPQQDVSAVFKIDVEKPQKGCGDVEPVLDEITVHLASNV